jgi:hypothetical protein
MWAECSSGGSRLQRVVVYLVMLVVSGSSTLVWAAEPIARSGETSEYGTVSFKGVPPTALVEIDGQGYGQAGLIGPTLVRGGEHAFRIGKNGVAIRLMIPSGVVTRIVNHLGLTNTNADGAVTLGQVVDYYRVPTLTNTGLFLTGTGTLSMVIGLAFGYAAVDVARESQGLKRDEVLRSKYDAIAQTAQEQVLTANVFLITGGALLISGLSSLYFDGYFETGDTP